MVETSIIVPGYNEERRMRPFLEQLCRFAKSQLKAYELIFVDDGSRDKTLEIFNSFKRKWKHVRVVSYSPNHGKGYAVKKGVFAARGKKILFIDIDGSISPKEVPAMIKSLDSYDVVAGSRALKKSEVRQSAVRRVTSSLFNPYVNLLFRNRINDHLCGFKGFRRNVARDLFGKITDMRWIFDVELFWHVRHSGYSLKEQPIHWVHKGESKMKLFDPIKMGLRLIHLRMRVSSRPSAKRGKPGKK